MNINRIDQTESLLSVKNTEKVAKSVKNSYDVTPMIAVSDEVRDLAELQRVRDLVLASPNIRLDKIAEVKAKMADPAYLEKAIDATADLLIKAFRL